MLLKEIRKSLKDKDTVSVELSIEIFSREDENETMNVQLAVEVSVDADETENGLLFSGGNIDEIRGDEIIKSFRFEGKQFRRGMEFPSELIDNIFFIDAFKDSRVVDNMADEQLSGKELEALFNDYVEFLVYRAKIKFPVKNYGRTY